MRAVDSREKVYTYIQVDDENRLGLPKLNGNALSIRVWMMKSQAEYPN